MYYIVNIIHKTLEILLIPLKCCKYMIHNTDGLWYTGEHCMIVFLALSLITRGPHKIQAIHGRYPSIYCQWLKFYFKWIGSNRQQLIDHAKHSKQNRLELVTCSTCEQSKARGVIVCCGWFAFQIGIRKINMIIKISLSSKKEKAYQLQQHFLQLF